jgi:hypothetical protein
MNKITTFPRFVLLVLLAGAAVTQAQEMKRYTVEGDEFSVMLPKLPAMTTTRGLRTHDANIRCNGSLRHTSTACSTRLMFTRM